MSAVQESRQECRQELTAGIVIIGNEILSGKTVDSNSSFLARELREIGVTLRQVIVIPDELDLIGNTVRDFHEQFDLVFTSGGVGPTHDDITMEGIAHGLGRRVVRHPILEGKLREYSASRATNAAYMKMADIPEGAELLSLDTLRFPTVKIKNIYILPGIPEILQQKFLALKGEFVSSPYYLKIIYTNQYESVIAESLNETLEYYPELLLGSYPKMNDPEYRVKVTLESKDQTYVEQAFAHLMNLLSPGGVVKTEE